MFIAVKRSSSGFVVRWSDEHGRCVAPEECIHLNLLRRSQQLMRIYNSLNVGEDQDLGMQGACIRDWLDFVRDHAPESDEVNTAAATTTAKLAAQLKAADFLDDQLSVVALCEPLAARLLASLDPPVVTVFPGPPETAECGIHHVMEALPESLLVGIFRAAMSVAWRDVFCNLGNDRPDNRNRDILNGPLLILPALLERFPPRFWPSAVIAAFPSAVSGSLKISQYTPADACKILLAAAHLPQLTSLRLKNLWDNTAEARCPEDVSKDVSEVIAVLCGHSCLASLQLHNAAALFPGGVCHELCRVLPSLPQLTALSLARSGLSPEGKFGSLWQQLCHLRALRTLDVSAAGLDCEGPPMMQGLRGEDSRSQQEIQRHFLQFVDGIKHLSALEELVLSHNGIGESGWALLAPVASALPIRSLDLTLCRLGRARSLLFRDDEVSFAFASLERLAVGEAFSVCNPSLRTELLRCDQLKELDMKAGPCYDQFWQGLLSAPFRLEALCLSGWAPADVEGDHALRTVLERMTGLQRLELRSPGESESWLGPLAGALPCLRALTCLHLHHFVLGSEELVWEELAAGLKQLKALEELSMKEVRGELAAHSAIAAAVATLTRLTLLELSELWETNVAVFYDQLHGQREVPVSIDCDAFVADTFATCLQPLANIKVLRLGLGAVSSATAPALTGSLVGMSQMQILELENTDLQGKGAQLLAQALQNMPALQEITLWSCGSHVKETGQVIASALPRSVTALHCG